MKTAGALGIDLGASSICIGVVKDGNVEIIGETGKRETGKRGNKTTPTYISFRNHPTESDCLETLIGEAAKEQVNILGKC